MAPVERLSAEPLADTIDRENLTGAVTVGSLSMGLYSVLPYFLMLEMLVGYGFNSTNAKHSYKPRYCTSFDESARTTTTPFSVW